MLRVRGLLLGLALTALAGTPTTAQSIYPLNRAEILLGSKFDFKVELDGKLAAEAIKVTINGRDAATVLGKPAAIEVFGPLCEQVKTGAIKDVTVTFQCIPL